MKKRVLALFLVAVMAMGLLACGKANDVAPAATEEATAEEPAKEEAVPAETEAEQVTLTMGSWRTDDTEQMKALLAEYNALNPNVVIEFQPTNPPDYNATLRLQLEGGTGPDLMYARSYATGAEFYDSGFFMNVSDIPGIKDNFSASTLEPWTAGNGDIFAVPFAAVSHAVYYNKDIFKANGIEVPATYEDFLKACETLKKAGVTPLANGVADEWDILETFFLGMLPNYIGGAEERVKYEDGTNKINDEKFVAAYTDMAKVAPYLPDGFEAVTYNDSQVLFSTQAAAMFVDGSWSIGMYDDAPFEWGFFAIPAPAGGKTAICFHPDMAITGNAATTHEAEVKAFLEWLCTKEGVEIASKALPTGFFPMIEFPIQLEDVHANECLGLNTDKALDARFVWPKLMDLYAPMNQSVIGLLKGELKPQEAADAVAAVFPAQ